MDTLGTTHVTCSMVIDKLVQKHYKLAETNASISQQIIEEVAHMVMLQYIGVLGLMQVQLIVFGQKYSYSKK